MNANITIPDGWTINYENRNKIERLLLFQYINMGIGGTGIFINFVLLSTLISSKYFLKNGRLTILLCIGDLTNCLYIFLEGYQRSKIYNIVLGYQINLIQTYWSCALIPFDWMGLLGSLIPHMVTFVMGLERIIALKFPILFKKFFNDSQVRSSLFCIGYVVLSMIFAFTLAYVNKNNVSKYYCGRKASYTSLYTSFIYVMNVFGYFVCFLLTLIVMLHIKIISKTSLQKRKQIRKKKGQTLSDQEKRDIKSYQRIKLIVLISFISSVTISFPSLMSLISTLVGGFDAVIADISDWISVLKSSINFFVYIFMNNEFKNHLFGKILNLKKYKQDMIQVKFTKATTINMKKPIIIA